MDSGIYNTVAARHRHTHDAVRCTVSVVTFYIAVITHNAYYCKNIEYILLLSCNGTTGYGPITLFLLFSSRLRTFT